MLDNYCVDLRNQALLDLENIYQYIAGTLLEPAVASRLVEQIEEAIYSLETMPYRGSERKHGIYADKGYRQLFVANYTVIYTIEEAQKQVIIITIRHSASNF